MASTIEFVEYVCEQISGAGIISYKKMFGEFGIYCNAKFIGLICSNQFFLKETERARALLTEVIEAHPYTGAKNYFLIDFLEDRVYLSGIIRATYDELPMPKPKKVR